MRVAIFVTIAAIFGLTSVTDCSGVSIWKVPVTFGDGINENVLYVGGSTNSTDGYDALEEMDAYFSGDMSAYFYRPEWRRSRVTGGTDYYMADIRSWSLPQTWNLSVKDTLTNRDITVRWDVRGAKNILICEGIELEFIDSATGASLPMTDGAHYRYYNAGTTPRVFIVNAVRAHAVEKLSAPQNLLTNPGQGVVNLRWDDGDGAVGFRVYRSTDGNQGSLISGDKLVADDDGDGTVHFLDKSLPRGKRGGENVYTYTVVGVDKRGCEGQPAAVAATR